MNIQINSLTNANIYIDGVGLLGRAEEIEIAPEAQDDRLQGPRHGGHGGTVGGSGEARVAYQVVVVRRGHACDVHQVLLRHIISRRAET